MILNQVNTKLEEKFGGFLYRTLVVFEFEKSPLHSNVYGATGTGKTYFVRQYLKLYLVGDQNQNQNQDQNQNQNQEQKQIIVVCKDEKDWNDSRTGVPFAAFEMGDINIITMKNTRKFKNSVIVLDKMGDKFNKDIVYYFTEGRNKGIQSIVMCHKQAQLDNLARKNWDTIYKTTYNGADLFKNFNEIYKCKHDFHGII